MGDEREKTCPLCAEEMDLTDQHLKPCKCGYQICVWCWHHIIEMAEKDETEGRCPACRTPYDKEKIVGMAANCERLVAEVNLERKKSQKAKPKPLEGRKQLSSVRVIQRNLVYIVGLPLDLADEDLLQRKEYFAQYGKVLKASMSRTAAGVVQQFPNNTCSVYITYSKEEEAIRCIQSVHGFVLDGRPLKACFGTTKYCHAWLRNVPCTNPDCLYLHEIGSPEDSFTKDEIISAYMRSRVQQITGVTNNLQRRSGSMLPPPVDDYCNNGSMAKSIPKVVSNNTQSILKSSPPNGSTGRSITLPAGASWGMRSSSQPSVPNPACSSVPLEEKPGAFVSAVANAAQMPVSHSDVLKKAASGENGRTLLGNTKTDLSNPLKQRSPLYSRTNLPEKPISPDRSRISNRAAFVLPSADDSEDASMSSKFTDSFEHTSQSCRSIRLERKTEVDGRIQSVCGHVTLMTGDKHIVNNHCGGTRFDSSHCDHAFIKPPGMEVSQRQFVKDNCQVLALDMPGRSAVLPNEVSRAEIDERACLVSQLATDTDPEIEDDVSLFNRQRLKDPEFVSCQANMSHAAGLLHTSNHIPSCSSQYNVEVGSTDTMFGSSSFDHKGGDVLHLSHGHIEKPCVGASRLNGSLDRSILFPDKARDIQPIGKSLIGSQGNAATGMREDSIIADILSLDLDEPLTSPHNLVKLLTEADKEAMSLKLSKACTVQNNESRFSFARQEGSNDHTFESYGMFNQISRDNGFYQDSAESRDPYMDSLGMCNGLSSSSLRGFDNLSGTPAFSSFNKLPSVSRSPVSPPPGFSVASRAPPPGFSSNGRIEHAFDGQLGSRVFESTLLRNSYQAPPVESSGGVQDIELMDPAILAVGQGRLQTGFGNASLDLRSNFQGNMSAFENEAKLRLLMQNPLSPHQSLRFSGLGDGNLCIGYSHGMSSRLMDQPQGNSLPSPFSQLSLQQLQSARTSLLPNGHWDGWNNDMHGGNRVGMADLLRNERLGFNKFYGNCEGSAFQMRGSGGIYNGKYGI